MDLTVIGNLFFGFGPIYFLLALVAFALARTEPKEKKDRTLWTWTVVILFGTLPAITLWMTWRHHVYSKEAWAYFRKMCAERAGEKIYKTYTGVKSVVVTKPLPPATEKDLYDQYWYGDPYTNATPWDKRGESIASRLVASRSHVSGGVQKGLDFVEIKLNKGGEVSFWEIDRPASNLELPKAREVGRVLSRFGVSWEDVSSPEDRKYWVAASRFRIVDLSDNSVVAERIGYLIEYGFGSKSGQRRPWLSARGPKSSCPKLLSDYSDQNLLMHALVGRSENI